MANINYIRNVVRNILDKDGKGWIGDNKFNNLITEVQDEVFNDIYTLYTMALQKRRARLEYQNFKYSGISQIKDDLRPLFRSGVTLASADNVYTKSFPSDYRYLDGISLNGKTCEIYDTGETTSYMLSGRAAPTTTYPAAILDNDSITIYPNTITSADNVTMSYYKNPRGVNASGVAVDQSPTWAYTAVGNSSVYNASNSIQLELPESTYNKVIVRMVSRYGINLREAEVVQYANQEEAKNQNQF